ncbi:hypothetical protein [Catellatospora vulcania]|uniref:hypothetical protein n=1 Tax=Catellatospora vulcania TaxID=1460450 RepID=UPI0012D444AE|nr:hypothetical protein [Catellatospora vulcania]
MLGGDTTLVEATPPESFNEPAEELFTGRWEQRNWRNVPGPFHAGETASLAIGRLAASDHIR